MNDMERQPLLDTSRNSLGGAPESISVPPIRTQDLPQTPTNNLLACLVCGSMIDISDKKEQHVVKCTNCNEATPIREAPHGRRFVRCPCNCLLVCNATASRISCPRPQCRRIIIVTPDSPTNNLESRNSEPNLEHGQHQYNRILCAHCKGTFMFTDDSSLARCPHCRKLSTINPRFTRIRGTIFLILALVILAATLGVIFGTLGSMSGGGNKGFIVLDVFLGGVCLYLLYRSGSYFFMNVSVTV